MSLCTGSKNAFSPSSVVEYARFPTKTCEVCEGGQYQQEGITGYLERGNFFGLRNRRHALLGDGGGGGIRHFFFELEARGGVSWGGTGFQLSLSNLVVVDEKKNRE